MTHVTQVPPQAQEQDPAKDAASLARADAAHSPQNPQPPQNGLLAGKYKTVDELVKGYQELQSAYNKRQQPAQPVQPQNTQQTPPAQPQQPAATEQKPDELTVDKNVTNAEDAAAVLESKGLNFDEFAASYAKNGKLTDDDYKSLEAKGVTRAVVDTYVAGVEALRTQQISAAHALVGGKESFDAMRSWAAANMSQADLDAYNESVSKGGKTRELALLGLKSAWSSATGGKEPSFVKGNNSTAQGDTFASIRELSKAQADPRYGKDPVYTREVEAKAARSKI